MDIPYVQRSSTTSATVSLRVLRTRPRKLRTLRTLPYAIDRSIVRDRPLRTLRTNSIVRDRPPLLLGVCAPYASYTIDEAMALLRSIGGAYGGVRIDLVRSIDRSRMERSISHDRSIDRGWKRTERTQLLRYVDDRDPRTRSPRVRWIYRTYSEARRHEDDRAARGFRF